MLENLQTKCRKICKQNAGKSAIKMQENLISLWAQKCRKICTPKIWTFPFRVQIFLPKLNFATRHWASLWRSCRVGICEKWARVLGRVRLFCQSLWLSTALSGQLITFVMSSPKFQWEKGWKSRWSFSFFCLSPLVKHVALILGGTFRPAEWT